jgi:uncharacterized membrane protein
MSNGESNLGVAPNLGGLLTYAPCCIGLIFSIVVAAAEKQNRFMRFHAFQSLLLHAIFIVISIGAQVGLFVLGHISSILSLLGSLLMMAVGLAMFGLIIFMMFKAYSMEEMKLPVIGDMASKWV